MKEVKRHFLISSLILAISTIFAKVLGAVYRIPLTNVLKSEGIGLYQLTFPVYAFIIVLVSSGFSLAITRECAVYFKEGKDTLAKKLFKFAVWFCVVLSLIFSCILVASAPLISKLQGNGFLFWLYLVFAVSIVFSGAASVFRGYFMAREYAIVPAVYNIIAQGLKLLTGLFLAYYFLRFGMLYACLGASIGITISEIFAFLFLFIMLKIKKLGLNKNDVLNPQKAPTADEFKLAKKTYLKAGFLLTAASSVIPLLYMLDGLIVIRLLCDEGHSLNYATTCYGELYGVVNSLINLPVMLAGSISLALMPSLSAESASSIKLEKARTGINAGLLVSIFCFVCFLVFAPKIISFLYKGAQTDLVLSKTLLSLSSVSVLSLSLIPILGSILQAQGNFFAQTISVVIAGGLKVAATLTAAFCFNFNIIVLAVINILCFMAVVILNYIKISRTIKKPLVPIGLTLKYLFLTAVTIAGAAGCKIIYSGLSLFLNLILSGITLAAIYILFVYILKLFKTGDAK